MTKNFHIEDIATTEFVKQIHIKMFDKTWRWAGHFRKTNKNMGVDWVKISVEYGKGRHARMMADILLLSLGSDRFTWGNKNLVESSKVRADYMAAWRAADNNDYNLLKKFVRA